MEKSIILIGMPHSGKSLVGRQLAENLDRNFIDTDALIEEKYTCMKGAYCSVKEIYKKEGNLYFRSLEKEVFEKVVEIPNQIIATGGGTPIHLPSFETLTQNGSVWFLYCSLQVLWQRISDLKTMPETMAAGNPRTTFQELYKSRLVQYLALSHHRIDVSSKTPEQVAQTIMQLLPSYATR